MDSSLLRRPLTPTKLKGWLDQQTLHKYKCLIYYYIN